MLLRREPAVGCCVTVRLLRLGVLLQLLWSLSAIGGWEGLPAWRFLPRMAWLLQPTVAFAAEVEVEVRFAPGLNLFAYPVAVPSGLTCADMQAQFGATAVHALNAQTQRFATCAPPATVFPLVPGAGYLVEMPTATTVMLRGEPSCPVLDTTSGLHLRGFPSPLPGLSCFTLLAALQTQADVATLQRFDPVTGAFQSCSDNPQAPGSAPVGTDFPIRAGESYLVSMRSAPYQIDLAALQLCNHQPVAEAGAPPEVAVETTVHLDGRGLARPRWRPPALPVDPGQRAH